ncbi:unnamed protein product, partial [Phaeothamnion confervicola]
SFGDEAEAGNCIVALERADIVHTAKQPYVVYTISVRTPRQTYEVERRYSDFVWLHDHLVDGYGAKDLPPLPPRRVFGDPLDFEFIETRKVMLNHYLSDLMATRGSAWMAEQNGSSRVEVCFGMDKRASKQALAKGFLAVFFDRKHKSQQHDDDSLTGAMSALFKKW